MVRTVKYGISVIQGLFSVNPLELGDGGELEKYKQDMGDLDAAGMERKWKIRVGCSWNAIQDTANDDREESEVATTMITQQLPELDALFITHFLKQSQYFMTTASSWTLGLWGCVEIE